MESFSSKPPQSTLKILYVMLEKGGVAYVWCLGYSQTNSRCPCPEEGPGSSGMSPPYGFRYLFSSLLQTECLHLYQCSVRAGNSLMILCSDETLKRPVLHDENVSPCLSTFLAKHCTHDAKEEVLKSTQYLCFSARFCQGLLELGLCCLAKIVPA